MSSSLIVGRVQDPDAVGVEPSAPLVLFGAPEEPFVKLQSSPLSSDSPLAPGKSCSDEFEAKGANPRFIKRRKAGTLKLREHNRGGVRIRYKVCEGGAGNVPLLDADTMVVS